MQLRTMFANEVFKFYFLYKGRNNFVAKILVAKLWWNVFNSCCKKDAM